MAETNIPMQAMISHCGWETKSLHTIFRYVFTSISNDIICGNNLARWFYKVYSEIYGGVPPTLDYIRTESHMVNLFLGSIFVHNTGIHYKTKLNHILAAYALRFYDGFLDIIIHEPSSIIPFTKIFCPHFFN